MKRRDCVREGEQNYMRFGTVWDYLDLPGNCSTYAVDVGGQSFGSTYTLDIYRDSACTRRLGRQHDWRAHRDDAGCFDVDDKPTGNLTLLNFKLTCGSSGNGIVVQRYSGAACTGTKTDKKAFPSQFYMVTWAELDSQLFMGKCQDLRDGTYGKFRKPLNSDGYMWPDCAQFAKNGFLSKASNATFQYRIFPGNISTVRNAHAWQTRLHWPVWMLIGMLIICPLRCQH